MPSLSVQPRVLASVVRLAASTAPLIAVYILSHNSRLCAEEIPIPPAIEATLVSNATSLAKLDIEWEFWRTTALSDEQLVAVLGVEPGRPEFFGKVVSRFALDGPLVYAHSQSQVVIKDRSGKRETQAWVSEYAYDGEKFYRGSGDMERIDGYPILTVEWPDEALYDNPRREIIEPEINYFKYAGYTVPAEVRDIVRARAPKSLIVSMVRDEFAEVEGVEERTVDGANYSVITLRTTAEDIHEFYLLPKFGYALAKWDHLTASRKPIMRVVNSDFERIADTRLWLPRTSRISHFAFKHANLGEDPSPEVLFTSNFRVVDINTTVQSPEMFSLAYPAGTFITDSTYFGPDGQRVVYQMPADPAALDDVIRRSLEERPSGFDMRAILFALNILIICILLFYLYRRRARSH